MRNIFSHLPNLLWKILAQEFFLRAQSWSCSFFFFLHFKLEDNYFIILRWFLPYINMNQPQISMSPPSQTSLPPPSPSHPSRLSQSIGFGSNSKSPLVIYFTYGNVYAPLSMEFSRPKHWSGQPFPSLADLPDPRIKPRSLALQVDSWPSEPPGKPHMFQYYSLKSSNPLPDHKSILSVSSSSAALQTGLSILSFQIPYTYLARFSTLAAQYPRELEKKKQKQIPGIPRPHPQRFRFSLTGAEVRGGSNRQPDALAQRHFIWSSLLPHPLNLAVLKASEPFSQNGGYGDLLTASFSTIKHSLHTRLLGPQMTCQKEGNLTP